jgi:hypothetical protein
VSIYLSLEVGVWTEEKAEGPSGEGYGRPLRGECWDQPMKPV